MTNDQDGVVEDVEVKPMPGIPWSVEFFYVEDSDGEVWVVQEFSTPIGKITLFGPPGFIESTANKLHTIAVKAKHHKSTSKIEIATIEDINLVKGEEGHEH